MLKGFLSLLRKRTSLTYLEVLLVFLLSLTPLLWFRGEEVILGHDSGYRLLSLPYLKSLVYSWNPSIGFGVDWAINKGFLVTQLPEVLVNYFTGSLSIAQRFSFVLWFFVMGISMYIFVNNFFPQRKYWLFRVFSSTFYVYNFFILQAWFIGERAKFSLYAALPLIILVVYKTIKGNYSILKGGILFSFLVFFLNGGGSPPLYGSILLAAFLALIFFGFIEIYKHGFKHIFRLCLVGIVFVFTFLVLNAYWVLPQVNLFLSQYESELSSLGGVAGTLRWEGVVNQYSSFINLFRLQGIPDWYSETHPFSRPFIENPLLIVAGFIPILLILVGLWFYLLERKEEKRKREIIFFGLLLFLIGLVFTAGSHPPFGFIYIFLIKYLPGFAIFRTAFYKFAPVTWFPVTFLTGLFLNFLILKFIKGSKQIAAGVMALIFILGYHYPYFSDKFFNWNPPFSTKVSVPNYVYEMSEYINAINDNEGRILIIPPMDPQFNSDNYSWGYWSLDPLPRISTTKVFLVNDTKREELVEAIYSAIERRDEVSFIYFANLAGVNKVLWRDDILYNNKISTSKDASFWEDNLKSFSGVSLEKEEGKWRLYDLDDTLYQGLLFSTPETISYLRSDNPPTEETFNALNETGRTHILFSGSSVGKDLGKILTYSDSLGIEAICVYCKPGEYMKFVDDLSLPYTNFLPGSLFYPFIKEREEKLIKGFEDFPQQRIDANLGIASKRLGEISLLIGRAESQDIYGREHTAKLIENNIDRYGKNMEDVMTQLERLAPLDKNNYALRVLGYLRMHKRSLSAIENKYNLGGEAFGKLFGFINEKMLILEKEVWVTEEETHKKYLVSIDLEGVYDLKISGHKEDPISIFLNGERISTAGVFLRPGVYRLELVYPEPQNLLEAQIGEVIDISKGESRRLKINGYNYTESYAVSFDYRASKNTRPTLIIFQDNDKVNILGTIDSVKYDLKTSNKMRSFGFTFEPNFLAREASLGFRHQAFNRFQNEEFFEVVNPRVYRTYSPKVFFVKEVVARELDTPKITTEIVSPTEYKLEIRGAKSPFILNFLQSFNNGWKAYFVESGVNPFLVQIAPGRFFNQVDPSLHFSLDGYSNAWLVDRTGDYEMRIIYAPQSFFYVGLLITAIALPTFIGALVFIGKRRNVEKN